MAPSHLGMIYPEGMGHDLILKFPSRLIRSFHCEEFSGERGPVDGTIRSWEVDSLEYVTVRYHVARNENGSVGEVQRGVYPEELEQERKRGSVDDLEFGLLELGEREHLYFSSPFNAAADDVGENGMEVVGSDEALRGGDVPKAVLSDHSTDFLGVEIGQLRVRQEEPGGWEEDAFANGHLPEIQPERSRYLVVTETKDGAMSHEARWITFED